MKRTAAVLLAAGAIAALSGCAAPAPSPCEPACGPACDACVPAFTPDGRLRRDYETGAPLFEAHPGAVAAHAPRFNDDGTVDRDPETGTPVFEEIAAGEVVRVLVLIP